MEKYRGCEAKLSYVVRVYFGIRTMHEYNAFYRRARMCFMESYFLLKPPYSVCLLVTSQIMSK
ncbi:hypothetical protein D3790_15115 [Xenorhabdus nematophila]|nr:hypothetical protein D3790_15115 [Xenorhabdus nematophila]